MAPATFPVSANIAASLTTTSTVENEIAGICAEGIFPSAPNDATPLTAARLDASILLLKVLQSVDDK